MDLERGRALSIACPKSGERFDGTVLDSTGRHLRIACLRAFEPGSAIVVEIGDTLLLGEVSGCSSAAGAFDVVVELDQAVLQTAEVARLARALLCEFAPSRPGARA